MNWVSWPFLQAVLVCMGFSGRPNNMFMELSYKILINGSLTQIIQPCRGLSTYLCEAMCCLVS